nr:uncharacterized protein LOC108945271 [Nicotiana tomentosiformis]
MGDSDLIIRQAQGKWETRDIKLIPYRQYVEDLSKRLKFVKFKYIPRFHNELADALATLASMLLYPGNIHINPQEIQVRERHGYCNAIKIKPDGKWRSKENYQKACKQLFLSGEILYKRTPYLKLLRCVDSQEPERIMNEVHSGVCGPHMNGYVLAKKILQTCYYWMTMEKDYFNFVRKCHQCQIHSDLIIHRHQSYILCQHHGRSLPGA